MALLKMMLLQFGLNKDRFHLEWVSAAEGEKFAQVVNDFVDKVTKLGPSPFRKMKEEKKMAAARNATAQAAVAK
jgi:F420-non-reducing hydrogenase iron-sulfur subunit